MTTGTRFVLPFYQVVADSTGAPVPGALLFFYASMTSTRQNTYADIGLTTPNTNPVQANASGVFPNIFLTSAAYKVVLTDDMGNQIWTADPVSGDGNVAPNQRSITSSADLPIQATDQILNIGITVPLTIPVPLASTRAGVSFIFKNLSSSTAVATITATSPDHFDALSSIPLSPGAEARIRPAYDDVNSGYAIG